MRAIKCIEVLQIQIWARHHKKLAKIWNCHSLVNIAQNPYYDLFLEMEQSFCICPCDRNPNPGTRIPDLRCNSPAVTKISAKRADFKSVISPSSGLRFAWFFFWNWVFFHKDYRSAIISCRSCTWTSRSAPQIRCPEKLSPTLLSFRSAISPSSGLRFDRFFFWNRLFFHKEDRSAIIFFRSWTKTHRSDLQTRRPWNPAKMKKKILHFCAQESALIPLVVAPIPLVVDLTQNIIDLIRKYKIMQINPRNKIEMNLYYQTLKVGQHHTFTP